MYIKEGAHIVDSLNIMEAYVSLMKLENVRILKEMRNSVNRKVNCETAKHQQDCECGSKADRGYQTDTENERTR